MRALQRSVLSFFRTEISGPPGHQSLKGAHCLRLGFNLIPKHAILEITIIDFNDRTRTPSNDHLLQQKELSFASIAVVTSLRSPMTECGQTKLAIMTECGMMAIGHCTEKRSDHRGWECPDLLFSQLALFAGICWRVPTNPRKKV